VGRDKGVCISGRISTVWLLISTVYFAFVSLEERYVYVWALRERVGS